MSGFVNDATIKMHPHPTKEKDFICYCAKYHRWGEKGTRTFIIPDERWNGLGWQMIECNCKTWHMRAVQRQDAHNAIDNDGGK